MCWGEGLRGSTNRLEAERTESQINNPFCSSGSLETACVIFIEVGAGGGKGFLEPPLSFLQVGFFCIGSLKGQSLSTEPGSGEGDYELPSPHSGDCGCGWPCLADNLQLPGWFQAVAMLLSW